jgi:hypothetical protein
VLHAIKISIDRWHSRLGHPSRDIVRRVVSKNNLPCATFNNSSHSVCDACACAKAHQLPYQLSSSTSSALLQLIFSDVWGPTIESFGRKKYYVSFINDYSKFTWIYLIHHKSDHFKYFLEHKHCCIVEIGLALLAHASMPLNHISSQTIAGEATQNGWHAI